MITPLTRWPKLLYHYIEELKADWGEIRNRSLRLRLRKERELVREKDKQVEMGLEI